MRTPLPKMKVFISCTLQFAESVAATSLSSYVGFMILDFGVVENETQVGKFTGLITSVFFISQFFSSYIWGALSDRVGRRPVLLFGMFGTIISTASFGFSKSVWMALLTRGINGILNGNVGIIKTYLAEITDSSNQSAAFGYYGLAWGLGSVVGPMLGGFLSQPADKYASFPKGFLDGLFVKYPFLLPNVAISGILLITTILSWFYLVETRRKGYYIIQESDKSQGSFEGVFQVENNKEEISSKWQTFKDTISDKTILLVCSLYMATGFAVTFLTTVFPIWTMVKVEDGGLHFDTSQIGITSGVAGGFTILFQLLLYNRMVLFFGVINTYKLSALVSIVMMILVPMTNGLAPTSGAKVEDSVLFWFVLITIVATYTIMSVAGFTTCSTMINNSVTHDKLGGVNGLAQTMLSLSRSIAPAIASYVFAWSLNYDLFYVISFRLSYYTVAFIVVICLFISVGLKKDLDKPFLEQKAMNGH